MRKTFASVFFAISRVRNWITKDGSKVIAVLNVIKEAINDEKFDYLVALTETKVDDKILAGLRKAFAAVLPVSLPPKTKKEDAYKAYIDYLRNLGTVQLQNAALAKVGSQLLRQNFNPKISEADADTLVQLAYYKSKV